MTPDKTRNPLLDDPNIQALLAEYGAARERIDELESIGTDLPRVRVLLTKAEEAFKEGNIKYTERSIDKAVELAERSTSKFLDNFIKEIRRTLAQLGHRGVDVSDSLHLLKSAESNRSNKDYDKASSHAFRAVEEVHGVSPRFKTTLMNLMKAKYNLVLAESLGRNLDWAKDEWERGFLALLKENYARANEHQWNVRMEVRESTGRYRVVMKKRDLAHEAISRGAKMGADIDQAQSMLDRALSFIEDNNLDRAEDLLDMAIQLAIIAGRKLEWDDETTGSYQSS